MRHHIREDFTFAERLLDKIRKFGEPSAINIMNGGGEGGVVESGGGPNSMWTTSEMAVIREHEPHPHDFLPKKKPPENVGYDGDDDENSDRWSMMSGDEVLVYNEVHEKKGRVGCVCGCCGSSCGDV